MNGKKKKNEGRGRMRRRILEKKISLLTCKCVCAYENIGNKVIVDSIYKYFMTKVIVPNF